MEMHDLKKKTDDELRTQLAALEAELRDLRFQAENLQLKSVRKIRETRRDIARIKTLLRQRTTA